jgi:catalase
MASSKPPKAVAAKSGARNTDSGASKIVPAAPDDTPATKMVEVESLVASMPFNTAKAAEHGFANGTQPPVGNHQQAASRLPTGSTLSEENGTEKTGSVDWAGVDHQPGRADRR